MHYVSIVRIFVRVEKKLTAIFNVWNVRERGMFLKENGDPKISLVSREVQFNIDSAYEDERKKHPMTALLSSLLRNGRS